MTVERELASPGILRARHANVERQQFLRPESGISARHVDEPCHEEAGAAEEHQAKGNLDNDERASNATGAMDVPVGTFLQGIVQPIVEQPRRRRDTEEHRRHQRHRQRKYEHAPVEARLLYSWNRCPDQRNGQFDE